MSNNQAIALVGFDGPLARVLTERSAREAAAERAAWKRLSLDVLGTENYYGNDPVIRLGCGAATIVADAALILKAADEYPSLAALTTESTDITDELVDDARKAYNELSGAVTSAFWDLQSATMLELLAAAVRLQQRGIIADASHFAAVLYVLVHVCVGMPTTGRPEEIDPDADFDAIWAELRDDTLESGEGEDD